MKKKKKYAHLFLKYLVLKEYLVSWLHFYLQVLVYCQNVFQWKHELWMVEFDRYLLCADMIYGIKAKKLAANESNEIAVFLDRAFLRLDAWFKWFNTSQSGRILFPLFLVSFPCYWSLISVLVVPMICLQKKVFLLLHSFFPSD